MNYANLDEVYGSEYPKKKKKKDRKVPLEPREMETKLLSKNDMTEFTKRNQGISKFYRMGTNAYDPQSLMYDDINDNNESISYDNAVGPNSPFNHPYSMYHYIMNDPDFKDFLVYKKMKHHTNDLYEPFMNMNEKKDINMNNNELDQLLLYIFTGLFILIMFDNIYKLGVNL